MADEEPLGPAAGGGAGDGGDAPIDLSSLGAKANAGAAGDGAGRAGDRGSPIGVGPSKSIDATRERIAYILLGTLGTGHIASGDRERRFRR